MNRKERINQINGIINDLREFDTYSGYQSMLNLLEEHIGLLIESFNVDCYDCKLWEQGKKDGTCIHYINKDCPYGYCDEYHGIKEDI